MNRRLLILLLLIPATVRTYPQVPKYSNEFLNIGVDARAFGLSGSVAASVTNVTAGYWNPAGLANLASDLELGLMHSEYFAGIAKYDYGGVAFRIDPQSVAGLSVIRFGVDDIPNTLDLFDSEGNVRYDRISTFSVADYGLIFSYARTSPREGFTYGANIKLIYRNAGDFAKAYGFGFDVGAQYNLNQWNFGITGKDITSTFNAWSFETGQLEEVFLATGNEVPENSLELTLPSLLLGAGRNISLAGEFSMMAELNARITFDGKRNSLLASDPVSIDPTIGLEFDYSRLVFLRMGMGNIQKVSEFQDRNSIDFQPSVGMGLSLKNLSVDYALTDLGDQSYAQYSHVFSLVFALNIPQSGD